MTVEQKEEGTQDLTASGEMGTTAKKPYAKPLLTVYGNVEEITKGGDPGTSDANATARVSTVL